MNRLKIVIASFGHAISLEGKNKKNMISCTDFQQNGNNNNNKIESILRSDLANIDPNDYWPFLFCSLLFRIFCKRIEKSFEFVKFFFSISRLFENMLREFENWYFQSGSQSSSVITSMKLVQSFFQNYLCLVFTWRKK